MIRKIKNFFAKIFQSAPQSIAKNIFKNIYKNKRIFVMILLFFILGGITLPKISLAGILNNCQDAKPDTWFYNYCFYFYGNAGVNMDETGALSVGDLLTQGFKDVWEGIILAASAISITVTATLANWASGLLLSIMGAGVSISYTGFDNPVVSAGWPMMRDLANMIIVLGFVVIGVAFTLRMENYGSKKVLINLIIAALLINFSLVICGVIIDASNIIMSAFFKGSGYMERSAIDAVKADLTSIWGMYRTGKSLDFTGLAVGIVLKNMIYFVVFMLFFCLFLFRYLMLWILVAFSPLAFVFWVFPGTKNFFNMWKSNFVSWCIIGIPASFFVYVADKVSAGVFNPKNNPAATAGVTGMLVYLVPSMFLLAGFLFSLKTSAMGASIITSRASSAFNKGKSMLGRAGKGTLKGAGKGLANVTGASRAASSAKNLALQWGEKFGLAKTGAADRHARSGLDEAMKNLGEKKDDELKTIAERKAFTQKARDEKAAAAYMLQKKGRFSLVSADKRESVAAHASSYSNEVKEAFAKSHPELMTGVSDKEAVEQLRKEEIKRLVNVHGETEESARKAIDTKIPITLKSGVSYSGYKPSEFNIEKIKADMVKEKAQQRKIDYKPTETSEAKQWMMSEYENELREDHKAMSPDKLEEFVKQEMKVYEGTITPDKIEKTQGVLTKRKMKEKAFGYESALYKDARQKLISDKIDELKKAGKTGGEIDAEVEVFRSYLTHDQIVESRDKMNIERLAKGVKKISPSKASELPKEVISEESILQFSNSQLKEIGKRATPELIEQINKFKRIKGVGISGQSDEYKKLKKLIEDTTAPGSKERKDSVSKLKQLQELLHTDNNFS